MYCYKCGQELGDHAKFCSKCGLKIVDDELVDLVVKMQEGSADAFETFYAKTINEVKSIVWSTTRMNEQEIEDIIQEIYMTVYQKIGTLNNPVGIKAWLRTIARNTATTYVQKKNRVESKHISVDDADEEGNPLIDLEDTMLLPEDVLVNKERQQVIHKMLKELPEMQYKVLREYYFSEKTVSEIAEQLGVHSGTVKSYLSKAREKMQKKVMAYQRMTGVTLRSVSVSPVLYTVFKGYVKEAAVETVVASTFKGIKDKIAELFGTSGKDQIIKEAGKNVAAKTVVKAIAVGASVSTVAVGVTSYIKHDEREIRDAIHTIEIACQTLDDDMLNDCLSAAALKSMKKKSLVDEYVDPQVLGYRITDRTDFSLNVSDIDIEGNKAIAHCIYTEENHSGEQLRKEGYITFLYEENTWRMDFCRMNKELFQTGGNIGNIRFPELLTTELIYNDELEKN